LYNTLKSDCGGGGDDDDDYNTLVSPYCFKTVSQTDRWKISALLYEDSDYVGLNELCRHDTVHIEVLYMH